MRGRAAVVAVSACLGVLLASCTGSEEPADPASPTDPTGHAQPDDPTGPDDITSSATATTAPPPTEPPARQPLVIAVSPLRPTPRISTALARRVIDGDVLTWSEIGEPGGDLRLRIRQTLPRAPLTVEDAVVIPAEAVTPLVQVTVVGGADPLLEPSAYPIRTKAERPVPTVNQVTIVGDIMFGRGVGQRDPGRPGAALSPMARRLAAADVTVGNLESTLSDEGRPTQGDESFFADPRVLPALEEAGFDVLSLANNHTGDYGDHALRQTMARLDATDIDRVGAGTNSREAWRPRVVERDGVTFGFVAFNAIGETPRATPRHAGAAEIRMPPRTGPLSDADLSRAESVVRRVGHRVDIVVVLPHWGTQYTNQPVPAQREVGSALLDAGADVIVGGHPHWVQGVAVHGDKVIVNSMGNFVFDMDFSVQTQQGVMVDLVTWGDELKAVRFTPYQIGADFAPRLVHGQVARTILDRMWETSDPPFRAD